MSIGSKIFLGVVLAIPLSILWLLWSVGILTSMAECDRTDYSPIIKKVAVPMQQELEKFYIKNKRFPTTKERDEMLGKVGCKIEGNVCVYEKDRIKVESQVTTYDYNYDLMIENTYCTSFMNSKGKIYDIWCQNKPCISLKQ